LEEQGGHGAYLYFLILRTLLYSIPNWFPMFLDDFYNIQNVSCLCG
jgi:hypothetical protein